MNIKFQDNINLNINLQRERCYYYFSLDEDDQNYDKKYKEYVKKMLTPSMDPITIYIDNKFHNKKIEDKYRCLIEEELESYNQYHEEKKEWKDIRDIVKKEYRYERD